MIISIDAETAFDKILHQFFLNKLSRKWAYNNLLFFLNHFIFKSLQMVTEAMKLKDASSLEEKLWPT